jgi:hypothetical protein
MVSQYGRASWNTLQSSSDGSLMLGRGGGNQWSTQCSVWNVNGVAPSVPILQTLLAPQLETLGNEEKERLSSSPPIVGDEDEDDDESRDMPSDALMVTLTKEMMAELRSSLPSIASTTTPSQKPWIPPSSSLYESSSEWHSSPWSLCMSRTIATADDTLREAGADDIICEPHIAPVSRGAIWASPYHHGIRVFKYRPPSQGIYNEQLDNQTIIPPIDKRMTSSHETKRGSTINSNSSSSSNSSQSEVAETKSSEGDDLIKKESRLYQYWSGGRAEPLQIVTPLSTMTTNGHAASALTCRWHPYDLTLCSGGLDGSVRFYAPSF